MLVTSLPSVFFGAFAIGFSGAMMPGPMLTVTIREAARRGFWAGPLVVLGHGLLELALVVALFQGLGALVSKPLFLSVTGCIGGSILLWMAWSMLWGIKKLSLKLEVEEGGAGGNPVLGGIVTSLSNPYFTLWWATVGLSYVSLTMDTGWQGPTTFFTGHLLADLVWYSMVSGVIHFGRRFISDRVYRGLVGGCAILLIVFGITFIRSGLTGVSL